ncbi:hypothetical protein L6452_02567 [Arctium lappa]|uniref:Uncharacterized protein n=1 Tax=Arctium lappa TaxID=4217 RepID=A0ACB9FKE4_ARCLA|nr:hypothetical protein L6452_02567 [Arctium lappa]
MRYFDGIPGFKVPASNNGVQSMVVHSSLRLSQGRKLERLRQYCLWPAPTVWLSGRQSPVERGGGWRPEEDDDAIDGDRRLEEEDDRWDRMEEFMETGGGGGW